MKRPPTTSGDQKQSWIPTDIITRLLISLLIALLLWGWVTTQQNPPQIRTIAELPISAPPLPNNLQIGGELGNVTLQLGGPRSIIESLDRTNLEPTLDLNDISAPGNYTVPISVPLPPAVSIDRIDPPQLSIVVDEATVRTVPLEYIAEQPDDGARKIGAITPEVSEVTVEGPRRLVEEVDRVLLQIDIGDRVDTFTGQFSPVAVNAAGQPIPEVGVRPRRVLTTVEVEASGRTVPVLIQTVGSPAPGYELGDEAVDPRIVLLDGPDDVLNSMVSVQTAPVNVEGATSSVSGRVGLIELPPDVRVLEPQDGLVTVVIQVRERGVTQTLAGQPVVISGIAAGLRATARPDSVAVVVFGAEDELSTLRAGDITLRASAAGLGVGTHQIPLTVELPPGMQWVRTEPAMVEVTLVPIGEGQPTLATPRREMP